MQVGINERGSSRVAVITSGDIVIGSAQDALDLLATMNYVHSTQKIVLRKENISEDFFSLSTGMAGEILQKFVTYGVRLCIVGDFSGYTSKSLRDFIYESNKGSHVNFLASEAEALDALHGIEA